MRTDRTHPYIIVFWVNPDSQKKIYVYYLNLLELLLNLLAIERHRAINFYFHRLIFYLGVKNISILLLLLLLFLVWYAIWAQCGPQCNGHKAGTHSATRAKTSFSVLFPTPNKSNG